MLNKYVVEFLGALFLLYVIVATGNAIAIGAALAIAIMVGGSISGGHFNPANAEHAGPADAQRHAGDLGNVLASADGIIDATIVDAGISLLPGAQTSVIGRSCVLHADVDDLGRGGHADSKTTGHAGARIACGVIGLAADVEVVA